MTLFPILSALPILKPIFLTNLSIFDFFKIKSLFVGFFLIALIIFLYPLSMCDFIPRFNDLGIGVTRTNASEPAPTASNDLKERGWSKSLANFSYNLGACCLKAF